MAKDWRAPVFGTLAAGAVVLAAFGLVTMIFDKCAPLEPTPGYAGYKIGGNTFAAEPGGSDVTVGSNFSTYQGHFLKPTELTITTEGNWSTMVDTTITRITLHCPGREIAIDPKTCDLMPVRP